MARTAVGKSELVFNPYMLFGYLPHLSDSDLGPFSGELWCIASRDTFDRRFRILLPGVVDLPVCRRRTNCDR